MDEKLETIQKEIVEQNLITSIINNHIKIKQLEDEDKRVIAGKLYDVGFSQAKIGKIFNVSQKTISNWLKEKGDE